MILEPYWIILNHIESYWITFKLKACQVAKKVLPCRCFISCSRAWVCKICKGLSDSAMQCIRGRFCGASWTMPSDSASKADVAWPRTAVGCRECLHVLVSEGSSVCKHKCIKWHQVTSSDKVFDAWSIQMGKKEAHDRKVSKHISERATYMWDPCGTMAHWFCMGVAERISSMLATASCLHSVFSYVSYVHQARSLSTHR